MKKLENFSKALGNLHEGLELNEPYTVVEQTGIVGLFEICFEQAWKVLKEVLEKNGRFDYKTGSPRAIIKVAYQCGMIEDCEGWLSMLETRNILAHTYSDEQALNIIRQLKSEQITLFDKLKDAISRELS